MRPSVQPLMRLWFLACGLMMASAAPAQEEPYAPSLLQLLTPNPFASLRPAPAPKPLPPRRTAASTSAAVVPIPPRSIIDELIAAQARANGVPEALVHRVIKRESRYDPRAVGLHGAMGLMQIKHATARALGYAGPAAGLLDPETNLTYAVRYLAGALRAAGGDPDRGYALYRSGYYTSKRAGTIARAQHREVPLRPDADTWGLHGRQ
jgi:soluble lytic murein transglycosylase-like protein